MIAIISQGLTDPGGANRFVAATLDWSGAVEELVLGDGDRFAGSVVAHVRAVGDQHDEHLVTAKGKSEMAILSFNNN
jgi:hypothetical protein